VGHLNTIYVHNDRHIMHKSLILRSARPRGSHLAQTTAYQIPFRFPVHVPKKGADMSPGRSEKKNKYLARNSKLIAKCCQNTSETYKLIGSIIHLCIRIVNTGDMPKSSDKNMGGAMGRV